MPKKSKELIDLWIIVAIIGSLSIYHVLIQVTGIIETHFRIQQPIWGFDILIHGLYFWMVGLLYIAYKRWQAVLGRERELEAIISSTGPEVVLVVNPDRSIESCNDSVLQIFGYLPKEVLGKSTDMLYEDRRHNPNVRGEIYEVLNTIGFHIGEARGRHKDGHSIALEIVTAEKKDYPGVVLLIKDITARKRAEKTILEAKDAAEFAYQENQKLLHVQEQNYTKLKELESSRDTLTHMIVHDMKTPLQVLSLNADFLLERTSTKLEKSEQKSLHDIRAYCTRLDVMMKSMLDVSRMEDQQLPLHPHLHDPSMTLDQVIDLLGNSKMHHLIQIVRPGNLPPIEYDDELIQRVLLNLLINAIKYSPRNSTIRVELNVLEDAIEFSIRDEGAGIPKSQQRTIFDKFEQIQRGRSRTSGSTGLGLTYCHLAIEAHKGSIGVRSDGKHGSSFWFTLPMPSFVSERQENTVHL